MYPRGSWVIFLILPRGLPSSLSTRKNFRSSSCAWQIRCKAKRRIIINPAFLKLIRFLRARYKFSGDIMGERGVKGERNYLALVLCFHEGGYQLSLPIVDSPDF